MANTYLRHYGVLGMHWRRKKGSTTVIRTHNSEDHDKKVALKGKRLSEMTNDELRAYTQRSMLEKQFKDLSKNDISLGKRIVNEVINSATAGAKKAAMDYVNKQSAKMIEELIKKMAAKKAATP